MSDQDRPRSGLSLASSTVTISSVSMGTKPHSARPVRRVHTFGKRSNSIKRDPNSPVIMRGWLYKQDSSGLKLWKRRWFVLSNYCLFYYRDSREEMVLGSIPLPSYEIRTAFSKEKKNRRFVFKAEHPGMRTYYFSADTQLDMNSWIRAMNQSAAAECDYGSYTRGLHSQSVSTHTSFEDVTLTPDDFAKSTESLEIARLSETRDAEASSPESLHVPHRGQGSPKEAPCPRRISLSSSLNGGYPHEQRDQPDLSSLSSQTHGCPSPLIQTNRSHRPRSPPPPLSESPSPSSPSLTPQASPLLSIRSSRSYSLPLTPAESPRMPDAHPSHIHARQKPPRTAAAAAAQAASCEDLSGTVSPRILVRPNTPMGRVDIAPSEGPPNNPYAVASPGTRGRPLTPADRYDVFPSSEDPYGRRYTRSPHPSRAQPVGEEGLTLGRQPQNRFADRSYFSPSTGPSRALVMSRLHGRLITPHSASSSYLHLPPLPPLPNRSTPGKRTSLGTTCRTLIRERSVQSAGGQRFESDTDALLTKLCGQDKLLRGLEEETGQLRTEKERLEKSLEVTRLRLDDCKGQDATMEKILYQQRQLQDELVHIRARLCDLALDSERAWEGYATLENELQILKGSLEHVRKVGHPQDQTAAQQDLWRIHDILAGLRSSPANCQTLESRRSGVSPATTPTQDSHVGTMHTSLLPCSGVEESETASPRATLFYHESTSCLVTATQDPGRVLGHVESRHWDSPGAAEQASPCVSSRGQQGASRHSDGSRRTPKNSSSEPLEEFEKGNLVKESNAIGPDHGSHINIPCEDGGHSVTKMVSSDTTAPRRSRMSAQEQLDRMQRNQEAQRRSEAAQSGSLGRWRDSLKCGSSRPLPNTPPEPSPKEGAQTGGLKPRCPPTPEWERQRVIQLSYALAAEASQRGRRIAERTSSHSSLDDVPVSHGSLSHHPLPSDSNPNDLESNSVTSKHDQTAAGNPSCSDNSRAANQTLSSSQTSNQVSCPSEASNWSLPLPEEANRMPSKPKAPSQLTSQPLGSANEESSLLNGPLWTVPLSLSANRNSSVSSTANWASPPIWDSEVWASDNSLVGHQGPGHAKCLRWRSENKSHQVVTYLGETAQPIKVTMVKSSF
ncbi:pleckstrin homology domain-containing family A member 4 isoform X2 [Hemicordylus capensis]|uniref:pleckstrin homology domain-containing family A member 4 isoform X2 n=1 Tax=Hemicordylus capensis TaxID=884348 RepID=UPI002304BED1|nr:pleckstrin homology domain-containing family A member 4 isoform X2 [Hemicordylus capensis]